MREIENFKNQKKWLLLGYKQDRIDWKEKTEDYAHELG